MIIFSLFVKGEKSLKANQKPRNERTGTRLGRDVDTVSQKSHIILNRASLATFSCKNDVKRLRVRTKHESDDSQYNFIQAFEIKVEEQR